MFNFCIENIISCIVFLCFLNVCIKFNEWVGTGGSVDLVSVLTVEFSGQILQKWEGRLSAELSVTQSEKAGLLLYQVTEKSLILLVITKRKINAQLT